MDPSGHEGGATAGALLDEPPGTGASGEEAEIAAALGAAHEPAEPTVLDDAAPTTRELLAEVASREPHGVRPPALEARERSYVAWLLASTLLACVVLLTVLWWLDPISVTGRETRFSVVENGGVRQAKLDLMEELPAPPDVLVLGSSRSMKVDPAEIERVSGATAFNGAVSGGTTQDMYLYARYADELWGRDGEYPHLVIGVVNDVFRYTGTAALDPRLRRFLPRGQQERDALEVARQLLQLKTLEAAARAVRRVVARDGVGALLRPEHGADRIDARFTLPGRQKGNQREHLDPRGMQGFDPGANYSKPLAERVETQMRTFVERSYEADPGYEGIDERGLELLVRTIRLANSHGDVPTLWVTPYHPAARELLPDEHDERDARFRAAIRELQRDSSLRFTFVDLDDLDSFGGDPREFHDGIHMTEANTARVAAHLHAEDMLAPRR